MGNRVPRVGTACLPLNKSPPPDLVFVALHVVFVQENELLRILKELGERFAEIIIDLIVDPKRSM